MRSQDMRANLSDCTDHMLTPPGPRSMPLADGPSGCSGAPRRALLPAASVPAVLASAGRGGRLRTAPGPSALIFSRRSHEYFSAGVSARSTIEWCFLTAGLEGSCSTNPIRWHHGPVMSLQQSWPGEGKM